mgnify:CR=1 FL=1
MDDEEAKRIQEERDKDIKKEYDDVTNPKKPNWDVIDPPMKGQGLVNEALMIGASAGIAAAAKPLLKTIGPAGAIDAGINILTGESDTAFEKKLEIFKPAKVAVKSTRLLTNMLTDVFDKRVTRPVMESTAGEVYATTDKVPEPSPEPAWRKTPRPDEKKIWMDRFTDEVLVDEKGRHISKRTEDGYKFLGKFRAEWNAWSKDERFIRELADKPATAYVEHLVRKAKGMDWFWNLPNEVRFRKGSRHSPNNVRILYDNRYKSLKDATETILYNELQVATNPMNRLVIDLDIPKMKGKSITYKQAPKDLVIKRVDGTIVGRIGDYHDILYAPDNPKLVGKENTLSYKLGTNVNPRTGRPYINLNTTPENIAEQVTMWRSSILRDKLQFIIDEAPTLKGKTKLQKTEYQSSAILEDMNEFLKEYSFIGPSKKFRRELKKEPFQSARGGKPVKRPEDKLEGIFMNKEQERRARRNMYRRTWIEDDLNKILRDE